MKFRRAPKKESFFTQAILSFEFPEKHFYPLSSSLICPDMRLTTLPDLLGCLRGTHGEKIVLDSATDAGARRAMDRMLELG